MVHGSVNPGSATNTSSSSFNNTASTSSTTATTNPNTGSHNRTTSAGTDTMTMMDEEMDIAAAAIQLQQSTRMSTKEEQCDEGGGATVMEIDQDEVTMVDLSSSLSVIPSTNASPSKSTPVIQQKPSTAAVTITSPSLKKILHSCENQGCKKVYTSYSGIYRHRPLCPWKPKSMETVPSSSSSVIATTARRGRKNKSTLSDSDISAASDAQEEDDYDALNDEDHDKGEEGGNSDDEMVDEYKEDDGEDEEEQSARISATTTRRRSGRVRKPVIQPQLASTRTSSRRRRLSPPSEEVEEEHDGEESQSGDEENGSEDELRPKPPVAARTNRYTFTNPVPPPVSSSASTTASSAPSNRYAFSYPVPAPAASSTTTTTASYANINTTSKPRSIYMSAAADSAHHNKQTDVDEIAAEIAVPGKRVTVKVYGTMMPRAAKLSYTDASDEEEDTGEKGEVDRGSQEEDLDEEDGMEESEEEEDVDDSEAEFKPDAKVSVIIEGNKKKVIVEEHDDESSFDGSVLDSEEEDGDDAGSDSETGVGGGAKIGFMKKLSSRQHLPAPVISECDPSSLMASKRNRGKPKALHPGTVAIKEKIEGLFYKTGGEGQEQEMKMDKDEQKPPIPLEWVDNRMPCPNPACKQRFSGRAYLEQHLRHYTHEIFDILEWGFPAPVAVAAAAAAAGSSSETTTSSAGSHSDSALISPALPPPEIPDLEKEGSIEYRLSKIEESVRRVCDYVDTDDLPIKIKMDLAMWKKAKYLQTPRPPPETILQCELLFGYSIEREEAELKWQDFKNKPLSKQRVASASTSAAAARGGGGDKKVYKRRTSKYDPEISAKPTPTSFSNISTTTVKHGNDYPEMFVYPGLQPCLEHFQIVDNE